MCFILFLISFRYIPQYTHLISAIGNLLIAIFFLQEKGKQMVDYTKELGLDCTRGTMFYKYKNIRIYTIIKEYPLTYWYTVADIDKKRVIPSIDIRTLEYYKEFEDVKIYLHRGRCVPKIIREALKKGELTDEMWVSIDEFPLYEI